MPTSSCCVRKAAELKETFVWLITIERPAYNLDGWGCGPAFQTLVTLTSERWRFPVSGDEAYLNGRTQSYCSLQGPATDTGNKYEVHHKNFSVSAPETHRAMNFKYHGIDSPTLNSPSMAFQIFGSKILIQWDCSCLWCLARGVCMYETISWTQP